MNERNGNEWLDARYQSVTGTDVGKIMGCDDTTSRQKLCYYKLHKIDPLIHATDYTKRLVRYGGLFENAALGEFRRYFINHDWLYNGYVPGMSPHKDYSWITGTPDYIADLNDNDKCVVEIKTHWSPSPELASPIKIVDTIPLKYWLQVQTYLEILDINEGFQWSWILLNGYTCFHIARLNDFWNSHILPRILDFRTIWDQAIQHKSFEEDILTKLCD